MPPNARNHLSVSQFAGRLSRPRLPAGKQSHTRGQDTGAEDALPNLFRSQTSSPVVPVPQDKRDICLDRVRVCAPIWINQDQLAGGYLAHEFLGDRLAKLPM